MPEDCRVPHHRLVISHHFVRAVSLPGVDLIKAWTDCRLYMAMGNRGKDSEGLEPLNVSFRHLLWNPRDEQGALTDFDLDSSGAYAPTSRKEVGGHEVDDCATVIGELLTCKAPCDKRTLRTERDLLEPYVWMLASAYVGVVVDRELTG
ncbi:hypothetical protein DXG01_003761 [Tephrocybe rancida]|nr:hypothetical protein DXG01_003761 [Tephrocybe rancida]